MLEFTKILELDDPVPPRSGTSSLAASPIRCQSTSSTAAGGAIGNIHSYDDAGYDRSEFVTARFEKFGINDPHSHEGKKRQRSDRSSSGSEDETDRPQLSSSSAEVLSAESDDHELNTSIHDPFRYHLDDSMVQETASLTETCPNSSTFDPERERDRHTIIGMESGGIILTSKSVVDAADGKRVVYIFKHSVLTGTRSAIYKHHEDVKVIAASLYEDETILAFTTTSYRYRDLTDRDRVHADSNYEVVYETYFSELTPQRRQFRFKYDEAGEAYATCFLHRIQFLPAPQNTKVGKKYQISLLRIVERRSIDLYYLTVERKNVGGRVMCNILRQPDFSASLVKGGFTWYVWTFSRFRCEWDTKLSQLYVLTPMRGNNEHNGQMKSTRASMPTHSSHSRSKAQQLALTVYAFNATVAPVKAEVFTTDVVEWSHPDVPMCLPGNLPVIYSSLLRTQFLEKYDVSREAVCTVHMVVLDAVGYCLCVQYGIPEKDAVLTMQSSEAAATRSMEYMPNPESPSFHSCRENFLAETAQSTQDPLSATSADATGSNSGQARYLPDLELTVHMLHWRMSYSFQVPFQNTDLSYNAYRTLRVFFNSLGDLLIAYIPGYYLRLIDCGIAHRPRRSLCFRGDKSSPMLPCQRASPMGPHELLPMAVSDETHGTFVVDETTGSVYEYWFDQIAWKSLFTTSNGRAWAPVLRLMLGHFRTAEMGEILDEELIRLCAQVAKSSEMPLLGALFREYLFGWSFQFLLRSGGLEPEVLSCLPSSTLPALDESMNSSSWVLVGTCSTSDVDGRSVVGSPDEGNGRLGRINRQASNVSDKDTVTSEHEVLGVQYKNDFSLRVMHGTFQVPWMKVMDDVRNKVVSYALRPVGNPRNNSASRSRSVSQFEGGTVASRASEHLSYMDSCRRLILQSYKERGRSRSRSIVGSEQTAVDEHSRFMMVLVAELTKRFPRLGADKCRQVADQYSRAQYETATRLYSFVSLARLRHQLSVGQYFSLLETLYAALEETFFPFPATFHEHFFRFGLQHLRRHVFLQYLARGILRVDEDYVREISDILARAESTDSFRHHLLQHLGDAEVLQEMLDRQPDTPHGKRAHHRPPSCDNHTLLLENALSLLSPSLQSRYDAMTIAGAATGAKHAVFGRTLVEVDTSDLVIDGTNPVALVEADLELHRRVCATASQAAESVLSGVSTKKSSKPKLHADVPTVGIECRSPAWNRSMTRCLDHFHHQPKEDEKKKRTWTPLREF